MLLSVRNCVPRDRFVVELQLFAVAMLGVVADVFPVASERETRSREVNASTYTCVAVFSSHRVQQRESSGETKH